MYSYRPLMAASKKYSSLQRIIQKGSSSKNHKSYNNKKQSCHYHHHHYICTTTTMDSYSSSDGKSSHLSLSSNISEFLGDTSILRGNVFSLPKVNRRMSLLFRNNSTTTTSSTIRHNSSVSRNKGKSNNSGDNYETEEKDTKNRYLSNATNNQIKAILNQAQSIPNIITITRICSTPFLSYLILTHEYDYAMIGCLLAGFSDWLDGYIAKSYNSSTVLGTYLDPLADKILINSLALSLSYVEILPWWCVGTWFARDVLLVGTSYRFAAMAAKGRGHNVADPSKTPLKIQPSLISKINTVLQFGVMGLALGFSSTATNTVTSSVSAAFIGAYPELLDSTYLHWITTMSQPDILESLCWVTCGTTVWSGMSYALGGAMINSGNISKQDDVEHRK